LELVIHCIKDETDQVYQEVNMPVQRLKDFLNVNKIKYVSVVHSQAYTAQEIAELTHITGKELAKTVIVKKDDRMTMAVLPASHKIDWNLLKEATGAGKIELATEKEFKDMFPDCEIGAMPPFGNLYNMEVYVEESLTKDREIAFNAGSHIELVKLSYEDFSRLTKPKVVKFSSART
jgi:Ala-tRNA(Pro) deacylase